MSKGGYDPKNDLGAHVRLLGNMLDKATSFLRHVDTQANILIGICSGLLIFSLTQTATTSASEAALFLLAIFSALGALSALLAVHPPRFMRKQGQKESLLYHRAVSKIASADAYAKKILQLLGDQESITEQYAREIYNIYKYTYGPKRYFFNLGRNLLLTGIASSLVLYVVSRLFEMRVS